jgi:hypothetical protein
MTVNIAETYGVGGFDPSLLDGNVIQRRVAEPQEDGSWLVRTTDESGVVLGERPATLEEVTLWAPGVDPQPASTPVSPAAPSSQDTDTQSKLDALTVLLRAVVDTLPAESRSAVEAALAASAV